MSRAAKKQPKIPCVVALGRVPAGLSARAIVYIKPRRYDEK